MDTAPVTTEMDRTTPEPGIEAAAVAWLFYLAAVGFVIAGFVTMFRYEPDSLLGYGGAGQVVGGDAYNFMIIATRGVGLISAGVVSAILGLACQVAAHLKIARAAL